MKLIKAFQILTLVPICLVGAFSLALAQTESPPDFRSLGFLTLKGEQEGEYDRADYIVTEDVVIKAGDTMSLMAGTKIYFYEGAVFSVHGTLLCKGSSSAPVSFLRFPFESKIRSAESSRSYHGLVASGSGCISLFHTVVADSELYIVSNRDNAKILLDNVVFHSSVNSSINIGGKTVRFPEQVPVFYPDTTRNTAVEQKVELGLPEERRKQRWKIPVRITSGAMLFAGAATWWYYNKEAEKYYQEYHRSKDPRDVTSHYEKNHTSITYRDISACVAAFGGLAFTVTFFFGGSGK